MSFGRIDEAKPLADEAARKTQRERLEQRSRSFLRALVGVFAVAAVIALGIAVDLILYLFVPAGGGRSLLVLAMGPWTMRICGVEYDAAKRFLEQLGDTWKAD